MGLPRRRVRAVESRSAEGAARCAVPDRCLDEVRLEPTRNARDGLSAPSNSTIRLGPRRAIPRADSSDWPFTLAPAEPRSRAADPVARPAEASRGLRRIDPAGRDSGRLGFPGAATVRPFLVVGGLRDGCCICPGLRVPCRGPLVGDVARVAGARRCGVAGDRAPERGDRTRPVARPEGPVEPVEVEDPPRERTRCSAPVAPKET